MVGPNQTVLLPCITVLFLTRRRQEVLTVTYAVIAKEIRPHQCLAHSRTLPWSLRQVPNTGMFKYVNACCELHDTIDRICPLHRWWTCSHSCLCSKLLEDDDDNNLWRRISRRRQFIEFIMFAIANPIILSFIIALISRLCRDPRLYSDLKLCVCL